MNNKFESFLEKYLEPISNKISNQKDLNAIAAGLTRFLPVVIVGSLFYLIANFPITSYVSFLKSIGIYNGLMVPYDVTFGIMSIYIVLFISYVYAQKEGLDALSVGIVSLISFCLLTPVTSDKAGNLSYSFQYLGEAGMFVAILTAIIVPRLYRFIVKRNWVIKMPEGVPPFVERSFSSLIPFVLIAFLFGVVSYLFTLTSFHSVQALIYQGLQKPMLSLGSTFGGFLVGYMVMQILWFFGINGFNVVGAIMMPIWLGLDAQRLAEIQAGHAITSYVGMAFMSAIGSPAMAVALTFLLFAKSKQLKSICKIGLPAAIFNIAEPINFGIPTVLNAILFIPIAIVIPVVLTLLQYLLMVVHIIPPLTGVYVPQQVPIVIFGLVQGNWQLAIWQLLSVVISIAILYPFAKVYDKQVMKKAQQDDAEQLA